MYIQKEELEEKNNIAFSQLQSHRLAMPALKTRLSRYTTLRQILEKLDSYLSIDALCQFLVNDASDIIGKSQVILLYLVDQKIQRLTLKASKLKQHIKVKAKEGDLFDQWVLKHSLPLIVPDIKTDFRFNIEGIDLGREIGSLISAPLTSEQRVLGLLRLESHQKDNYSLDDLRLLGIISDLAAAALKNVFLYETTKELAIRDGLTGLYLRRHLLERLEEELLLAERMNLELSFLMLDIDYFKEYNDRYGHVAGDIVLKQIARLLTSLACAGDFVSRYGGEEFCMVLSNTSKQAAFERAEGIRQRIQSHPFILRRQKTKVTISVGIATFPEDAHFGGELIEKADSALYRAKQSGRNKVCLF
jgi:diguanylate cyclase (GGDEF)-like protein